MDTGSWHQAKSLVIPANVVCLFFPPESPDLNPIERWGREMKDQLAWVLPTKSEELAHDVAALRQPYTQAPIHSLTSSPSFTQATHALVS
jgi:transposase